MLRMCHRCLKPNGTAVVTCTSGTCALSRPERDQQVDSSMQAVDALPLVLHVGKTVDVHEGDG